MHFSDTYLNLYYLDCKMRYLTATEIVSQGLRLSTGAIGKFIWLALCITFEFFVSEGMFMTQLLLLI